MADQIQYVTLGVADDLFAVPVDRVQEILEPQPIAGMPHAPADFLGVIDVRGQSVPVIDLRLRLAMPPAEDTREHAHHRARRRDRRRGPPQARR